MQQPLYLRKITVVSIWFRMLLTQIVTWVYNYSLTLIFLIGITILIPTGGFLDTTIDVEY